MWTVSKVATWLYTLCSRFIKAPAEEGTPSGDSSPGEGVLTTRTKALHMLSSSFKTEVFPFFKETKIKKSLSIQTAILYTGTPQERLERKTGRGMIFASCAL